VIALSRWGDPMPGPTDDELWRVPERVATAPAHLVAMIRDEVLITACHWIPKRAGVLLTRSEMLAGQRFACTCCLRKAARR
jgi:hypothetical protein